MQKIPIAKELQKMNSLFSAAGFKAYLVGGAVRDTLLGKKASDFDIATNAKPKDVMRIFCRVIPTGIKHGTVTVHFMKRQIEVTTFRTEGFYSDGRHPDNVSFSATIEEDLSRRDFTMNAIAASLKDGTIVDPFCGRGDIEKKIIRTVGRGRERFMEDGLRPIRAIRFASQLGFSIEKSTFQDIFEKSVLEKIKGVSAERFRDEFCKILFSSVPSRALRLMEETGILKIFLPELLEGRNCSQSDGRAFHKFDVLDHNFFACDAAPSKKLNVRLASLFHDVAKPRTKTVQKNSILQKDEIHFYGHEILGKKMTQEILHRLKFSNSQIQNISHLVESHMFFYEPSWSDAAVRRFVQKVGAQNIEDLFCLRLADEKAKGSKTASFLEAEKKSLLELQGRIENALSEKTVLSLKDLAVNGRDLLALGIPYGKKIGVVLNMLFEAATENPKMNERESLLQLAKKFCENT